ncbi:MAG: type II secretion system major pseudopilin GspG [Candidatus Thiodiazotropha sp. (ex Lucinoma borealis)]|nr:type II secretion system major pseudopilin GspG [Candidatus Thiodiazotropha sp. (ex Lucinoma borealis)]MCU7866778.1 type II secretion system major pseudopilin GspG [Candidatus Thiodiazotropha sp. (ex Lucinoma borealis)]
MYSVIGFTLIELLVVLLIIGLLAGLAGPALYNKIKPARHSAAKAQLQNFMNALENYAIDVGDYPDRQQGLQALRIKPAGATGWLGPYINKEIPNDPWGTPYQYHVPGRNGGYEILSFGADKQEGGDGEARDVLSWESN